MVGNDVVDLDDPAIASSHLRERFVARICHESERVALRVAAEPKTFLWCLFAAKEAAFKVVSKLGPPPVFAHRKFIVEPGLVRYGDRVFTLRVEVDGRCVHAIAWTGSALPIWGVERGGTAREALLRRLAVPGARIERDPIAGSWDGFGPPRLIGANFDISLSHDGAFVAYAAASDSPE